MASEKSSRTPLVDKKGTRRTIMTSIPKEDGKDKTIQALVNAEQASVKAAEAGPSKRPAVQGVKTPYQPKRPRMQVIKPDFDDTAFADILLKLNDARYIICETDGDDQLVIRIQDCAFRKQQGDEKFVPRAVKLGCP